jgi:uncharacterized protein YbjT (DUF2867 family)
MKVNTPPRKAIVLGGTGLIGEELIRQLIAHEAYAEISVLGRRNTAPAHPKLIFYAVDMHDMSPHANLFEVNDVFCCLGTTIKKAGSQAAFQQVDREMVIQAAQLAQDRAHQFILISSLGANKKSGNFYLKTKGETEAVVIQTSIPSISILRPSILFGNRKEKRTGEKIGIIVMKLLGPLFIGGLKKFRGNHAETVARTMLLCALNNQPGTHIYESLDIERIGHPTPSQ